MDANTIGVLGEYVPRFIAAIVILIVGWFVSVMVSRGVSRAIKKTNAMRKIAGWFSDAEVEEPVRLALWTSRGVFALLMLFVLVAFFQTLGLTVVTEPITRFLNQVFEYAPRLIGPAVLVVAAWLSATLLRFGVKRGLRVTKLDQRIGAEAGLESTEQTSLSNTLGDTAYWLTLLLFLPAVLGALNLGGLLQPVQTMIDKVLGFLPNILAAAVIVVVGWLVARILQRLVSNLLAAIGADKLGDRVGLKAALGKTPLSSLIGLIVYILTLVPVLVAGLNALQLEAITRPASEMLNAILGAFPSIFAALLVLAIAYVVGRIVGSMASNVLNAAGFDSILVRLGIGREPKKGEQTPSGIVGYLVIVVIMLFATIEALDLIGFAVLARLVSEFLVFAGQVILGLIIFAIGLYLANLAANTVRATNINQAELLSFASRIAILVLAGAIGLRQMGVANEIITIGFGLLFGTVAVAAAVAFGIGGRAFATNVIAQWEETLKSKSSEPVKGSRKREEDADKGQEAS